MIRCFITLFLTVFSLCAQAQMQAGDSFNLEIQKSDSQTLHLAPREKNSAHNWFAGVYENTEGKSPIPREWRIDMSAQKTQFAPDLRKWQNLRPVYTSADSSRFESYIWYRKDDKRRWWSSDFTLPFAKRLAGTGRLPLQKAVAPDEAATYLSPGGLLWMPWRELTGSRVEIGAQTFVATIPSATKRAALAMRVPYPTHFYAALCEKLGAAKLPGVYVETIGKTASGRPLQLVRLEDVSPTLPPKDRATIVVAAREQATDHDASWVAHGLLARLLSSSSDAKKLRANTTWIFCPILDPDSAAASRWQGFVDAMKLGKQNGRRVPSRPEAIAYARYFARRADAGRTLSLFVGLYMLEGGESGAQTEVPHITSAFADSYLREDAVYLNTHVFGQLGAHGFSPDSPAPRGGGSVSFRLGGWCFEKFLALQAVYQVNGRHPLKPLSVAELGRLGEVMGRGLYHFAWNEGRELHERQREFLGKRLEKQAAEFQPDRDSPESAEYWLLLDGFDSPANDAIWPETVVRAENWEANRSQNAP